MLKSNNIITESKRGHTYLQWTIAMLANTTTLTYGLQTGWISPMTKVLQSEQSPAGRPMTDNEMSWVASVLCLAAVVGVPLSARIVDTYGRKAGIAAVAMAQALCWIIKLSSAHPVSIIAARIFSGLAAGGVFNVVPVYVKEISQDNIRGLLGGLLILSQNVGLLIMYAIGPYLDYYTVLWCVAWVPIVTLVVMVKAPESPGFLVKMGRFDDATEVIAFLRGLQTSDKEVQSEISSMKNEDMYFKSLPDVSVISILKNRVWRSIFYLNVIILVISSTNGCFAILTYASTILASSGVTFSPELQTLSFPVLMIFGSFISMFCVERFGRKPLLAATSLLISVAMFGLATIILLLYQGRSVPGWLSLTCMIVALTGYSGGTSCVPYIIMPEMFNFQIRAKMIGSVVTIAWFTTSIPIMVFAPVSKALGMHSMFYFFSALNLLQFAVALVLMPETKGKSVEQIEEEIKVKLR